MVSCSLLVSALRSGNAAPIHPHKNSRSAHKTVRALRIAGDVTVNGACVTAGDLDRNVTIGPREIVADVEAIAFHDVRHVVLASRLGAFECFG